MDTQRITDALHERFHQDGHRLVFWHDPEREFEESLPGLIATLDGVHLLRLDEHPSLAIKARLELEDPSGRYLLYAPAEPPPADDDWLLDIRLYSGRFSADRASMLLADLGLAQQSLRQHLAERGKFFASRERLERLKRLVSAEDAAADIDRKILAVLVKADHPEFFTLLITLLDAIPDAGLDAEPPVWPDLTKYGVDGAFWDLVDAHFGWRDEAPSLKGLLIRLMVSDLANGIGSALPAGLQHLVLPKRGVANAAVCLAQWRDSSARSPSYERLSAAVADAIKLDQQISGLELTALQEAKTFLRVEQAIAGRLRDRVLETAERIDAEAIREVASSRQDGYWASTTLPDTEAAPRKTLHAVYQALETAADLLALHNAEKTIPEPTDAPALFSAYTERLYRFDQYYRHFCECADAAEARGWDILKALRERVEQTYGQGFLAELALRWNKHLAGGLLEHWRLPEIPSQQDFFAREVAPILAKGADRRVFVIISDAFRYEAAQELTARLNGRYRFDAKLGVQLGVLPSYTGLGMAALLPHQQLDYDAGGSLRVDGLPCSALEQRAKVLEAVEGIAIKADPFMAMKKDEGRAFIKPYRVVYIYHDRVDAIGDKLATEAETFHAVRQAIDELADLTAKIINSLNGNQVLITADHGFLFQERPLGETDKNALREKPAGTVKAKKRYLLGHDLPESDQTFRGSTAVTAGCVADAGAKVAMQFWIPKGTNRFHFVGGARFVHGGAMPQEIAVPVIRVQHLKSTDKALKTKTRTVGVSVLGNNFKVTTNRHRFQLMQNEPVGERVKPVTLKVAIYDGEEPVTNVETLTFESTSSDMNHWRKTVSLTLEGRAFDSKRVYQLLLRDAETGVEEARFDVTIDLLFANDF
jgi:uncharacterized protein (TIGR02687 family)